MSCKANSKPNLNSSFKLTSAMTISSMTCFGRISSCFNKGSSVWYLLPVVTNTSVFDRSSTTMRRPSMLTDVARVALGAFPVRSPPAPLPAPVAPPLTVFGAPKSAAMLEPTSAARASCGRNTKYCSPAPLTGLSNILAQ